MMEIRNYSLTGYRSEIFDKYIEEVTMNPDMAFKEFVKRLIF